MRTSLQGKKLMILGAGILQVPAIQRALGLGIQTIALDMNPRAVGFDCEGVQAEVISTTDIPAVVACARKHGIDGIMTIASDMPVRAIAAVSEELGIPGPTRQTAIRATDKAEMLHALENAGVSIPRFAVARSEDEARAAFAAFDCDCILKPADSSGSRGVSLVSRDDGEALSAAFHYALADARNSVVVIEEAMRGPEVSVETLSVSGVCNVIQITDKITTGAPHFVEMGHTQPSSLKACEKRAISNLAQAAAMAIGIENGPAHVEIILTDDGPKIVEIGARLGGDCITSHLVRLSTGVDMVESAIRIALGMPAKLNAGYSAGSAIRFFNGPAGTISSIEGVEEALSIEGVQELGFQREVGDKAGSSMSSVDRTGYIIASGEDARSAVTACERALACVSVHVR